MVRTVDGLGCLQAHTDDVEGWQLVCDTHSFLPVPTGVTLLHGTPTCIAHLSKNLVACVCVLAVDGTECAPPSGVHQDVRVFGLQMERVEG